MFVFVMFFLSLGIVAWTAGERLRLHDDSMVARSAAARALADDAALTLTRIVQCEDASRVLGSVPLATGLSRRSARSGAAFHPRYGDGRTEHRALDPSWTDPWWDDPSGVSLHAFNPSVPSWVGSYVGMDLVLLSRFRGPTAGNLLLRRADDYAEQRLRYLYRVWDASTSVPAPTPVTAPRWHLSLGTPSNHDLRHYPAPGAASAVQGDTRFSGTDPYGRPPDSWGTFVPAPSIVHPHRDSPSRCRAAVPTLARYAPDLHPDPARQRSLIRPRVRRTVATGIPSEGRRVVSAVIADVRPLAPVVSANDPLAPLAGLSLPSQSWVHRVSHSRGVPAPAAVPFSFDTPDVAGADLRENVALWPTALRKRRHLAGREAHYHPDGSILLPPLSPTDPDLGHRAQGVSSIGHVPYVPSLPYAPSSFPLSVPDQAAVAAALENLDPDLGSLAALLPPTSPLWDAFRWHRDAGGVARVFHAPTSTTDALEISTGVPPLASYCHEASSGTTPSPVANPALCPDASRPAARALLAQVPGFTLPSAPSEAPSDPVVDDADYYPGLTLDPVHQQLRWVGGFPILAPGQPSFDGVSEPFVLRSKAPRLADASDAAAIVRAATSNTVPASRLLASGDRAWSSAAHRASHATAPAPVVRAGARGAAGPLRGYHLARPGGPCDPDVVPAPVFCRGVLEAPSSP